MAHPRVLDRAHSAVVMIDVQEAYRGATVNHDGVMRALNRLLRVTAQLEIPLLVTEQYPKGLGHTMKELVELFPPGQRVIEKLSLSCCGETSFAAALDGLHRRQIVVCGLEAHACVNQTVHDLLDQGYQVHLPHDAISSRFELDYRVGWEKMIGSGAVPTSVEMICLEWVRTAAAPDFKAVQKIIK
ncbi:MAG: isochorismatase family protein [Deltaproteobacteria bacterium]|nr:isochorismatase family protein [Deltaproteobacteria bacterium]MBI3387851.1 isochorismatase family protein [Deltaproteobacteria bacterium]